MTSKIVELDRPRHFVDEMQRGPFTRWRHEHHFSAAGSGTTMVDEVEYGVPGGPLGRLVNDLVLKRYLVRLLRMRNDHVKALAERDLQ